MFNEHPKFPHTQKQQPDTLILRGFFVLKVEQSSKNNSLELKRLFVAHRVTERVFFFFFAPLFHLIEQTLKNGSTLNNQCFSDAP